MGKTERGPAKKTPRAHKFPHLLMISASAGTGKTHALASRYVEFMLAPQALVPHNDISNILAITFTNKAAREMKERILESLKKIALGTDERLIKQMLETLGIEQEELQNLAGMNIDTIIERYSDFQVQTIDSFANRLANSAALELEIPPDFETTMTYVELLDYAVSLMLRGVGAGKGKKLNRAMDEFMELLNSTGSRSFIWNPESEMRGTFEMFLKLESRETGSLVFEDHGAEIESCLDTIRRTYDEICSLPLQRRDNRKLEEALASSDVGAVVEKQYSPGTVPILKGKTPKDKMYMYEDAQEKWASLAAVAGELALLYASSRYRPFGEVYGIFKETLESSKMMTGTLHISDISKRLNRYLREEIIPDVYLRLGERLYHFLIDEFQDTDPIQWKNLYPLVEESLSKRGSLFLVGDLKQAIYMFRSADYRIMRELYLEITGEVTTRYMLPASVRDSASVRELDCNYRSGKVILDYVEDLFKKRLKPFVGTEHFREDRTRLTTDSPQQATEEHKTKGYVRTIKFLKDEEGSQPEREALLSIIEDAKLRGYRLADMAILAAENKHLEEMVDWLTEAGIIASASSSLDIRNRRVVAEVIELLKFLDSPVDDLAFARFISGEIFTKAATRCGVEFGPEELQEIALRERGRERTPGYLYQSLRKDARFSVLWDEYMEDLYRKTGYCPLYDLVSQALRAFRVFDHFAEESASLVRLLETVNSLESRGKNSIKDFIEMTASDEDESFSLQLPEYTDSVKLMTFHKSKGLGFPVVINMIHESGHGPGTMYYDREGDQIKAYYITKTLREKNAKLKEICEDRMSDDQIQLLNELYVICTRARTELYNLVILDKDDGFFGKLFQECELGEKSQRALEEVKPPEPTPVELKAGDVPADGWIDEEAWSYSRWMDAGAGEAYHSVLENIEFLSDPQGSEITESVKRALTLSKMQVDPVKMEADVRGFTSASEVRNWFTKKAGREVFREREFVDEHGDLYRMDRVLVDDAEVVVIDFKTGQPKDYSRQMNDYLRILNHVYPGRKARAYVAYIDSGNVEEVV
jgi:ATP-dependent exoDNAse (exonuclease V) beta subunit